MVVLIYLSAWFSGTETAITKISGSQVAQLKQRCGKNAWYVMRLKKNMDRTIVTLLIGNNLVNILLASTATLIADTLFHEIGLSIMIGLLTFLIVVFGEITPKSNAIMNSMDVVQKNSRAVYYMMRVLGPIITGLLGASQKIIRAGGGRVSKSNLLVSDESIKSLATLGETEGVIKKIERDIIHHVFLFGDRKVRDVMVPFSKVFYLRKGYTISSASKIIAQRGFTRVPVVNEKKVVIGMVYSKDLVGKKGGLIRSILRKPFIVSAKSDVTDVFKEMKRRRIHVAIVNNEKGKHVGLVTLEDIIEELVGEIYDEYEEIKYRRQGSPSPSPVPDFPESTADTQTESQDERVITDGLADSME